MEFLVSIFPIFENLTFSTFFTINLKSRLKPALFFLLYFIKDLLFWAAVVFIPELSSLIPGFPLPYPWKTMAHHCVDFLFIFLFSNDKLIKKLLVFILSQTVLLAADAIGSAIFSLLTGVSVVDIANSFTQHLSVAIVLKILFIIIYSTLAYVFTFFLSKSLSKNSLKEFTPSILIIIIQIILFCTSIYRQGGNFSTSFTLLLFTEMLLCIFSDVYLIVVAPPKTAENRVLQEKLRCMEEVRNGEKKFFAVLVEKEREMANLRHDWNNLLQVAISQIDNAQDSGDTKAQETLLQALADRVNETRLTQYCQNEAINVLLNTKARALKENSIPFNIDCVLPEETGVEALDLCSIFSNLIDNAMEYCIANPSEKNNIKIFAQIQAPQSIIIRIENYAKLSRYNFSKTTKPNAERHGYGIDIVRNIASKYHGEFHIAYDRELVTASVFLP